METLSFGGVTCLARRKLGGMAALRVGHEKTWPHIALAMPSK
jgi:hypothetical protein